MAPEVVEVKGKPRPVGMIDVRRHLRRDITFLVEPGQRRLSELMPSDIAGILSALLPAVGPTASAIDDDRLAAVLESAYEQLVSEAEEEQVPLDLVLRESEVNLVFSGGELTMFQFSSQSALNQTVECLVPHMRQPLGEEGGWTPFFLDVMQTKLSEAAARLRGEPA